MSSPRRPKPLRTSAGRGTVPLMMTKRKSFEPGHRRKFLVVIDDTPECDRALIYAAKRAERTDGALALLHVIVPEAPQQWQGVEEIMRSEAFEEARALLGRAVDRARAIARIEPEIVIREGQRGEEILTLILDDEDIAILVLAAEPGSDGPGPLVSAIALRSAGNFPIPITIVPGHLDSDAILTMA